LNSIDFFVYTVLTALIEFREAAEESI